MYWVNFFLGEFFWNFKAWSTGHFRWSAMIKKPMLAYGKNMPKNNQFSVLCPELIKNCPEKVKNYPEKNRPKLRNFYAEKKIYPIHAVQPMWSELWFQTRLSSDWWIVNSKGRYSCNVHWTFRSFRSLPQVSWTHVLISNSWQAWLGIVDQNWLKLALAKLALGQPISLKVVGIPIPVIITVRLKFPFICM